LWTAVLDLSETAGAKGAEGKWDELEVWDVHLGKRLECAGSAVDAGVVEW
jgi:hypothetical protein